MEFYISLNGDRYIVDCITYPYRDYTKVEIPTPLPDGLIGGWHKWDGEQPVFDQAKYDQINQVDELRAAVEAAEARAESVLNEAMAIITGEEE